MPSALHALCGWCCCPRGEPSVPIGASLEGCRGQHHTAHPLALTLHMKSLHSPFTGGGRCVRTAHSPGTRLTTPASCARPPVGPQGRGHHLCVLVPHLLLARRGDFPSWARAGRPGQASCGGCSDGRLCSGLVHPALGWPLDPAHSQATDAWNLPGFSCGASGARALSQASTEANSVPYEGLLSLQGTH